MICQYNELHKHPQIFKSLTGLTVGEFDDLFRDLEGYYIEAESKRLYRANRQREIGGGRHCELGVRDQVLLTIVWLRVYPTQAVLGYLFGVSATHVLRTTRKVLPVLEAQGRDTMRMPQPGKKRRRKLDDLLRDIPELAVVVDTFEQRVQRPRVREEADKLYSGKKKAHTLKSQVAVDEVSGQVVDVSQSVPGPTADIKLLEQSGLMRRLRPGTCCLGDLAYVGIDALGRGSAPRRKPRDRERPPPDILYNTAFSRRRIVVEHTLSRFRRFQSLTQTDRHHRQNHTARVRAVAGLVNRQITHRLPC